MSDDGHQSPVPNVVGSLGSQWLRNAMSQGFTSVPTSNGGDQPTMSKLTDQLTLLSSRAETEERRLKQVIAEKTEALETMRRRLEESDRLRYELQEQKKRVEVERDRWHTTYESFRLEHRGGSNVTGAHQTANNTCINCINLRDNLKNSEQKFYAQCSDNKNLKDAYLTYKIECETLKPRNLELSEKLEKTLSAFNELKKSQLENMEEACSKFAVHISEKNDNTDRIRKDVEYYSAEAKRYRDQVEELKKRNKHLQLIQDTNFATINTKYERRLNRVERESYKRAEEEVSLRFKAIIATEREKREDQRHRFAMALDKKENENTRLKQQLSAYGQPPCTSPRATSNFGGNNSSIFRSTTNLLAPNSFREAAGDTSRKRPSQTNSNELHGKRLSTAFDMIGLTSRASRRQSQAENDADVRMLDSNNNAADDEPEIHVVSDEETDGSRRRVFEAADDEIVCLGERKASNGATSNPHHRQTHESPVNSLGFRSSRVYGSVDFSRLSQNYRRMSATKMNGDRPFRFDDNRADESTGPQQQPPCPLVSSLSVFGSTQPLEIKPTIFHFTPPSAATKPPVCVDLEPTDEPVEAPLDFNWVRDYYNDNDWAASTEATDTPAEQRLVERVPLHEVPAQNTPVDNEVANESNGTAKSTATVELQPLLQIQTPFLNDEEQRLLNGDD